MKLSTGAHKLHDEKGTNKSMKKTKTKRRNKKIKLNPDKISASLLETGRIIVRNLPFDVSKESLEEHFCKYGTVKDISLCKQPDGRSVGRAYIEYEILENARKAIEYCSGKDFMGRTITASLVSQQSQVNQSQSATNNRMIQNVQKKFKNGEDGINNSIVIDEGKDGKRSIDEGSAVKSAKTSSNSEQIKTNAKSKRKSTSSKKGRVIVRNISFEATEVDLEKYFGTYGQLDEVKLLQKPDGKLLGCGFIQFSERKNAAKAIIECSGKSFLGRPIVLDWALAKSDYTKANNSENMVKVKSEPLSDEEIKEEKGIEVNLDSIVKTEDESSDDESDDGSVCDDEDNESDEDDSKKKINVKQQHGVVSNDVAEGKTVFVKNIPFAANNNNFKECMERFGDVEYALICYDKLTEHSKGTGFVKYKSMESAQVCLSAGTELTLLGQVLDCHKALDRETIQAKGKKDLGNTPAKDSRNLYLVKEGVVMAGSKAAENVSVTDMAKRLQLEQLKTQMLRNLNMFVSNTRLVIHNLPSTYDDKKLFQLFKKHSRPGAAITESKVMRDMAKVDENGVGTSKEMGFVRFTKHEDALHTLRIINNNPDIFTVSKRPIVAFAIENRMVHKVRQQREQKSRDKNPLCKGKGEGETTALSQARKRKIRKRAMLKLRKKLSNIGSAESKKQNDSDGLSKNNIATKHTTGNEGAKSANKTAEVRKDVKQLTKKGKRNKKRDIEYTGVTAAPGDTKLRTKHNLKAQATLHVQVVRKDLKKKKANRMLEIQKEAITQPKQKKGKGKKDLSGREEASFNELVNKYKSKMTVPFKEKKWYDSEK